MSGRRERVESSWEYSGTKTDRTNYSKNSMGDLRGRDDDSSGRQRTDSKFRFKGRVEESVEGGRVS